MRFSFWRWTGNGQRTRQASRPRSGAFLRLEVLEDRALPSGGGHGGAVAAGPARGDSHGAPARASAAVVRQDLPTASHGGRHNVPPLPGSVVVSPTSRILPNRLILDDV